MRITIEDETGTEQYDCSVQREGCEEITEVIELFQHALLGFGFAPETIQRGFDAFGTGEQEPTEGG